MCTRKRESGLGFRDFAAFNQVLLAKPVWRLVMNPESLCARVLGARYYKEMDIMVATCLNGFSYTWRSIMHGRDLLKLGLIWRIGDGASIDPHV